jgi:DNA replication protein DnaC
VLTHPTHEALRALKLDGMAEAFAELIADDRGRSLDPAAWIGLMLDREQARRDTRRFQSKLRAANLRHTDACMEDVDYRTPRRLDRALFQSLTNGDWIDRHRSVLITGPCGVGKSWLACALGHAASRADKTVLYHRLPRLFADLELARGDGRFDRLFRKLARADLLILDDWGPDRLTAAQPRDLMEIVEERYGRRSTIITSQLPVETWHEVIGEPTFADAILDRLVHNAYRLALDGPSLRKPGVGNDPETSKTAEKEPAE